MLHNYYSLSLDRLHALAAYPSIETYCMQYDNGYITTVYSSIRSSSIHPYIYFSRLLLDDVSSIIYLSSISGLIVCGWMDIEMCMCA